jgi:hypothetical protein
VIGEVGPARLPWTQRGRRIPVPDDVHKALLFATGRVEEVLAKLRLTDKPLVDAVVGLEDHSEKDERIEAPPQVHFSDEAEPPALLAVAEKVLLADVTEERAIRAMQELNGSDVPRLL